MYQESTDKLNGSGRKDAVIFIVLIVFFLFAGTIATVLKAKFDSNVPLYVMAAVFGALLYIVYRLRIVGWRYTVFFKEPEPEYDARFDDYIIHEDYPYPVGTVVIERTVSAKGEILAVIPKEDIIALLEPGEEHASDQEAVCGPGKKEKLSSIVYVKDGKTLRIFFKPSDEFKGFVRGIMEK